MSSKSAGLGTAMFRDRITYFLELVNSRREEEDFGKSKFHPVVEFKFASEEEAERVKKVVDLIDLQCYNTYR